MEAEGGGALVEGGAELVLGVGGEAGAGAGGGDVGGFEGGAVADGGDLAPADPALQVGVGVGEALAGGEWCGQGAFQAEGLQAADALGEREGRPGDGQGRRPPVDGRAEAGGQPGALPVAPGGGLGPGDPAVVVAVDRLAGLEGGDLGHVDHVVDDQPVGPDPEPAVGVDGEVPEGVGGRPGRPGHQQGGGQGGQDSAAARDRPHRPLVRLGAGRRSRPARASAEGWSRTVR